MLIEQNPALTFHARGGGGMLGDPPGRLRLVIPPCGPGYADAQLDDYQTLPRAKFAWRPPVQLRLRARTSSPSPQGTLGFGFWNDPFTLSLRQRGAARRLPASPAAVWFFYSSPPGEIVLGPQLPTQGWTAMALRAPRLPSWLLLPLAALAAGGAQLPGLRKPILQAALGSLKRAAVHIDQPLDQWHEYRLLWEAERVRWVVDDRLVLDAAIRIEAPLGFVAWIDNQYAVAAPQRGFSFGTLPTNREQWIELEALEFSQPDGGSDGQ